MISFNPATWLAGNIGRAESSGVEIQSSLRPFAALTLRGFYSFTGTEDRARGNSSSGGRATAAAAALSFRHGPFDALLSASRVGARLDNDFGGPLGEYFNPAYTRLDATVTFRANAASETFLAVSNATDERYDEVAGYPAPGARFTIGTKVDF